MLRGELSGKSSKRWGFERARLAGNAQLSEHFCSTPQFRSIFRFVANHTTVEPNEFADSKILPAYLLAGAFTVTALAE
jgi:hypothetical protein